MEYYFNQLDPVTFQRLINAILLARFGEDLRITPLRGRDGGRDCETAPLNPYFEFQVGSEPSLPRELLSSIRPGRYLFQVKHHRTSEGKLADIRNTVISDFASELRSNVLSREGDERVNYFFLVTNVPTSEKALADIDRVRSKLLRATEALHADIWWQEQVVAYLDQLPSLWNAFPALFAGNQPPLIAKVAVDVNTGLPRAVRLALNRQYDLDLSVKFRQIELEQSLSKLYVDLDVGIGHLKEEDQQELLRTDLLSEQSVRGSDTEDELILSNAQFAATRRTRSRAQVKALTLLLREPRNSSMRKVILQGGPGQGKSTITQMLAQIHRQEILRRTSLLAEGRWSLPQKVRLPFRIELRKFADWLNKTQYGSVEEYLATVLRTDSGGAEIGVNDIHELLEKSRVLLIFDGLDEVGSDSLRDEVITAITECTGRLEHGLNTDLQVIITTRPPAMIGQRDRLAEFWQFSIAPMDVRRIRSYVSRWLSVQIRDDSEKKRIRESFQRRQDEPHVDALAKNPMQLSVLLQFIRLKGEAFPDRRAELYRDYFQIVIDRDVEKSPDLAANRRKIEALHEFLGYNIHTLTEVDQANRTLDRKTLLRMTGTWLQARGGDAQAANHFFRLGEERFGLIVASAGEGEETRYGFEIQPVQEYFAAAYISNQIPPDSAHAVFEALIRRPFWREVGLFLAGLRRPNEKADLIARARRLDQDETLGWRQDGRAMILQLLQEGVFSEPPYVFTQALDFLVDLIDSNSLRVQNEPKSMLDGLCDLVGRGTSRDFRRRVMALLPQYRDSQDEYSLYRLYRFAAKVISTDELLDEILTRQHDRPDLAAKLRLEWPMTWGIDLRAATARTGYWTVASERVWAETWWRTAMRSGSVPDLPAPPSLHQCLLEQFAIDPIRVGRYTRRRFPIIRSASNWAVWQLLSLQQLLNHQYAIIRLDSIHPTMVMDAVSQVLDHGKSVSFAGLETASRMALEDLITLSSHLA